MKFFRYASDGRIGLGVEDKGQAAGLFADDRRSPGDLHDLLTQGVGALKAAAEACRAGEPVELDQIRFLPPLARPSKIICVGLNYRDHSAESGYAVPDRPTLFARFTSSLIGHGAPIVRPAVSEQLDYEGELVAVIGTAGRGIPVERALDHVAGYSVFNDGSVRDVQHRTPQWTLGKNFDDTGAFGPFFVTADVLPAGARGLSIETRLNGRVVQAASTDDLVFDVATLVSQISEAMTLAVGDIIVTGTPSGVGAARKPPLWMKPGDTVEVEIEGVGVLRNPVVAQETAGPAAPADPLRAVA